MSEIIKKFRSQYPEYKDRSDEELKRGIYEKFYREQYDVTYEEFEDRFIKVQETPTKAKDLRDSFNSGLLS